MEHFLFELHEGLPRQGPGNPEVTLRAARAVGSLPNDARILDIGCGAGEQTLTLATCFSGHIIAVDIYQSFLDALEKRAKQTPLKASIETQYRSMEALDFPDKTFDLLWSEGAIYIMGFENGLRKWRRLIKEGGCLAVSEITWLTQSPPDEVREFWMNECPDMTDIEGNLKIIADCGYRVLDHFVLPEEAWWQGYYHALQQNITGFRQQYADNRAAQELCDATEREMDIYRRYSNAYGYVFYIMKKDT